jgi:hypothetical protein
VHWGDDGIPEEVELLAPDEPLARDVVEVPEGSVTGTVDAVDPTVDLGSVDRDGSGLGMGDLVGIVLVVVGVDDEPVAAVAGEARRPTARGKPTTAPTMIR